MVRLVFTNLKRHARSCLGLIVELAVLMVVFFALLNQLLPVLRAEKLYRRLDLNTLICATVYADSDEAETLADTYNLSFLWRDLGEMYVCDDNGELNGIRLQGVGAAYFERFEYVFFSKMDEIPEGNWAVIPKSLEGEYEMGKEYSVSTESGETIIFTVYAVLADDLMFIPPTENYSGNIISQCTDTILLVCSKETAALFDVSYVYCLDVPSGMDQAAVLDSICSESNVIMAMSCEEGWSEQYDSGMNSMKLPVILSIVASFLALAAMIANVLLKTSLNEYIHGIYYMIGLTWGGCVCIQILSDAVVLVSSIAAGAAAVCFIGFFDFSLPYFFMSVGYVFIICVLAEIFGTFFMRRRNITQIIEARE